jgi:hypothetical protein
MDILVYPVISQVSEIYSMLRVPIVEHRLIIQEMILNMKKNIDVSETNTWQTILKQAPIKV